MGNYNLAGLIGPHGSDRLVPSPVNMDWDGNYNLAGLTGLPGRG